MRVQATKKMTGELNKVAKRTGKPYRFEHTTMKPNVYEWLVDYDIFNAYDYGDYDISTGLMRAIKVVYPEEFYAIPRYITTRELHGLYESGDTLESFINRVIDEVEI